MTSERQAYLQLYEKLLATQVGLEAYQLVILKYGDLLGEVLSCEIQDEIDVKRVDVALDLLCVQAKLSKE
jgi:hypothetical protein